VVIVLLIPSQITSIAYIFFCKAPAPTYINTLSLHDALPILQDGASEIGAGEVGAAQITALQFGLAKIAARAVLVCARQECFAVRSEEHTSELQSRENLVCRLLLEKKKIQIFASYWFP